MKKLLLATTVLISLGNSSYSQTPATAKQTGYLYQGHAIAGTQYNTLADITALLGCYLSNNGGGCLISPNSAELDMTFGPNVHYIFSNRNAIAVNNGTFPTWYLSRTDPVLASVSPLGGIYFQGADTGPGNGSSGQIHNYGTIMGFAYNSTYGSTCGEMSFYSDNLGLQFDNMDIGCFGENFWGTATFEVPPVFTSPLAIPNAGNNEVYGYAAIEPPHQNLLVYSNSFCRNSSGQWALNSNIAGCDPITLSTSGSTSSGLTLPFSSTTGVVIGQAVTGTNIAWGTFVVSFITNTSVTLSQPILGTVGSSASINFTAPYLSPDGTYDFVTVTDSASGGFVSQGIATLPSSTLPYTLSVYFIPSILQGNFEISMLFTGVNYGCTYRPSLKGVVASGSGTPTNCLLDNIPNNPLVSRIILTGANNNHTSVNVTITPSTSTSGYAIIYGAQMEQSNSPSSYLSTISSASGIIPAGVNILGGLRIGTLPTGSSCPGVSGSGLIYNNSGTLKVC